MAPHSGQKRSSSSHFVPQSPQNLCCIVSVWIGKMKRRMETLEEGLQSKERMARTESREQSWECTLWKEALEEFCQSWLRMKNAVVECQEIDAIIIERHASLEQMRKREGHSFQLSALRCLPWNHRYANPVLDSSHSVLAMRSGSTNSLRVMMGVCVFSRKRYLAVTSCLVPKRILTAETVLVSIPAIHDRPFIPTILGWPFGL